MRVVIGEDEALLREGLSLVLDQGGFVAHKEIHMEPSLVAMTGAGILIVISGLDREFYLSSVEWETLLFFAGLFIMVGALVRTGVIDNLARAASHATHGNEWVTVMLILGVSFLFSGFVNNVPYAATMTPIVGQFVTTIHGHASSDVLWWALILGTVLDELERTDKSTALVTLCIGGGMGTATIIERV